VFHCCQAVLRNMVAQKAGCIVNMGSILHAADARAQWAPFVIAKSAMQGLDAVAGFRIRTPWVRVNLISLGTGDLDFPLMPVWIAAQSAGDADSSAALGFA